MNNRVTLAQLPEMTVEQVSALSLDQIELLLEDVADLKVTATQAGNILHAALHRRFVDPAAIARREAGKDSGKVTITEGDYAVACDLPKKVAWDQVKLSAVVSQLASMGEDPKEYIKTDLSVSETAYNAWPRSLKAIFEPARTVSTGKPTYTLQKRGEAA